MNLEEKKALVARLQREIDKEEHPAMGIEEEMVYCELHRHYFNVFYGCYDCRPKD